MTYSGWYRNRSTISKRERVVKMLGTKWLQELPNSECKQNLWCITAAGENWLTISSLAVKLKALLLGLICAAATAGSSKAVLQLSNFLFLFCFLFPPSFSLFHQSMTPLIHWSSMKTAWLCTTRLKSSINANPLSTRQSESWREGKETHKPHSDVSIT